MNVRRRIAVLLYFYFIHSALVGICLVFIPVNWLSFFGFENYSGHFFMTQAGVFHLIMAAIYYRAAETLGSSFELVRITIAVKAAAFLFLVTYYFFEPALWLVLFSGIVDGAMALILFLHVRTAKISGAVP